MPGFYGAAHARWAPLKAKRGLTANRPAAPCFSDRLKCKLHEFLMSFINRPCDFLYLACAWRITRLFAAAACRAGTLRVLARPGYADADLVKVFEQRSGSKVAVTVIDSEVAWWQPIKHFWSRILAGDRANKVLSP